MTILLIPAVCFAASGNVQVVSTTIAEDGQSANVNVEYVVTSDDSPEAGYTLNTNGFYKECFSPTQNINGSCNTRRYAYFRRSTELDGSYRGYSSVESIWCPGGYDDLGVKKQMSETLTIPTGSVGGSEVRATYYLKDVAGYGSQLYYGQIIFL